MRSFCNKLALLLAGLLLVMSVLFYAGYFMLRYFNADPHRAVFGYSFYLQASGVMSPFIELNDIVIVRHCSLEDVQVRDVIAVDTGNSAWGSRTTRFYGIITELDGESGLWFTERSDGQSNTLIPPVPAEQFIGKVFGRIPGIGRIYWDGSLVMFLVVPICMLLCISVLISRASKQRKRLT